MAVPLIDITRQYEPIRTQVDKAVKRVVDHGRFILGPEVGKFEGEMASYCGVGHALGVASGTDALLLALRACGVGPGDEVITSAFSFFASAGVISRLGGRPVFVDIDPDSYNIDPNLMEGAITERTKAIMPIHLFGQCADMDPILAIARKHGIKVVEDAAQAIGSKYRDRMAGSLGDIGCFSFFPTKNLGCAGDGGMIVTDDDEIAEMVRILRTHGGKNDYIHEIIGYNSRLDTIQAALLSVKLPRLAGWTEARRRNAAAYDKAFVELPLKTPAAKEWAYHIYNQYTLAIDKRDEFLAWLRERRIGHKIYYPIPFHMQRCFDDLGYSKGDLPASEKAAASVVSIPIFGEMTDDERDEVIDAVRGFFSSRSGAYT
jgi:dTDP-4-amino-4,6-dideoxygalactose transaminase